MTLNVPRYVVQKETCCFSKQIGCKNASLILLVLGLTMSMPHPSIGQDWNQWQGANRDGRWAETDTLDKFPATGPVVRWRVPVANGYAGPAVAEGRVVVLDYLRSDGDTTPNPGNKNQLSGRERILCFDASTGKELWVKDYDCPYLISYPNGPRATPTIDGDRVYTLGAEGHLKCLQLATGDVIWEKELKKDYQLESAPYWGFAAHPLIADEMLYCVVGGEGSVAVAFDKMTGEERWRNLSAKAAGYCPPTMVESHGQQTLIIWHSEAINGLDPLSGKVYWSYDLAPAYEMPIIAPVQSGQYVLATALQGTSLLLELGNSPTETKVVWQGKGIHSDHNPPLIVDGHIYGISGRGQLHGCELISGQRLWETLETTPNGRPANSATGFLVYNNDKFFIFIETGELLVAKLHPHGYEELGRARVLEPTSRTGNREVVWSHPAFAGTRMFARNDQELVCIELGK